MEILVELTGRPAPSNWCLRPFIFVFCLLPPATILLISILTGSIDTTWAAQFALGISSLCSMIILGDRPLINPLQAFVLVFQWWFCCGPAICAVFFYLTGDIESARLYSENHSGAVWVVAAGLPVFAVCAQLTLKFARRARLGLRFLLPSRTLYRVETLTAFLLVTAGVYSVLFVLGRFGLRAFEERDYLGDQSTASPALAAISSLMRLGQFATVGLLGYLASPARVDWRLKMGVLAVVFVNMGFALNSGSKGPVVLPVFFLVLLLLTYRQRVPWVLCLSLLAFYLVIVEPFVASSRESATNLKITNSSERTDLFQDELKDFKPEVTDWRKLNVESPFRFIYRRAVETSEISSLFSGPWAGQSLRDGYSAVVPRFLDPDKADSNMGNFFAHELGVSDFQNQSNNIAITIPFEFVGNYGLAAGVFSFGAIGVFWTLFTCFLLSEARLATHPLMPICVAIMMGMESSVGQFVNSIKDLPIPLAAAWLLWHFLGRRKVGV